MSKYNKGDKFILEVDYLVTGTDGDMYYKMNLDNIVLSAESLDKLQKCETELSWDESYIKGMEDAWEVAHRLNNMTLDEIHKVYGFSIHREEVFSSVDAEEALAKLEAYEKEQNEIKVGDIVYNDDTMEEGVVTHIDNDEVFMLYDDGSCGNTYGNLTKTGKHIDITSVLEQLRGD